MTVGDIRCPLCDARAVGVAADFVLGRSETTQAQVLNVKCERGHALRIAWTPSAFMIDASHDGSPLTCAAVFEEHIRASRKENAE